MKYSKIIHYIEKIDEIGNLSKASNALFISQPALSKFIQSIETKTGIKLFNKTRRSLHLSFAGERYLSYLKKINGLELDMRNELELISQNKKGKVTLGINSALATSTLYKFLPQFHQQNPNIQIEIIEKNTQILERMLDDNQIDLAIGMIPILNRNLSYEYLCEDSIYLLVSNSSTLYNPEIKQVELFPYDIKLGRRTNDCFNFQEYGLRRLIDQFYELNSLKLNRLLTISTVYTAISLVKSGMGSFFMPISSTINTDYTEDYIVYKFKNTC